MNANNSSLIPFNLSNEKLDNDNFKKDINDSDNQKELFIEGFVDSKLIESYESDSDSDSEGDDAEADAEAETELDSNNEAETNENDNEENENNEDTIESFSSRINKCPITFESYLCIAYTSAGGYTGNCGYYGCRVGALGDDYFQYSYMTHGGRHPQTFKIVHGNKSGNILSYGEGFYLYNNNRNNYLSSNGTSHMLGDRHMRHKCKRRWVLRRRRWRVRWRRVNRCKWHTQYRGATLFYFLPYPGSGYRKGDFVNYNDRVLISNSPNVYGKIYTMDRNRRLYLSNSNTGFYLRRPRGYPCQVQVPRMVYNGDYRIKKITVRCDDVFEMFIGGIKYKGSGWNKVFRFYNIRANKSGFTIAFKCYNGGGPGCLIACIELYNGSIIYTDESWMAAESPITNEKFFVTNTNNYNFGRQWVKPNVIGYNQKGKMKWDGKNPAWDQYFVDKNFSPLAKYIWAGSSMRKGHVYFSKTIGEPPKSTRCRQNLSFAQALCYMEANPDVKASIYASLGSFDYFYNGNEMNWYQHENEAKRRGGHIVCIRSAAENNYIRDKFLNKTESGWGLWIGAIRIGSNSTGRGADTWRWVDYSGWGYENFLRNHYEPNNYRENRAHMWKHNVYGSWNDLPGGYRLPSVYKIPNKKKTINMNDAVRLAQQHWKMYGCTVRENRKYTCSKPPQTIGNFDYKGCYDDDFNKRVIPNYRGNVTTLGECSELAEKNRETVFGVTNGNQCYTSNDYKSAIKNGFSVGCSTLGKRYAYQVYKRKIPYNPLNININKKNFSNKKEGFENQNNNFKNNNYTKIITLITIILILLLIYFYMKK